MTARTALRYAIAMFLVALLVTALTGCTEFGGAVRDRAESTIRDAQGQGTETALLWLCNGISRGELKRRFADIERAEALNRLCGDALPHSASGLAPPEPGR